MLVQSLVWWLIYLFVLAAGHNDTLFHRCIDEGEAYSASFLTTMEHFLSRDMVSYQGTKNTELASFIMLETRLSVKETDGAVGKLIQTRDVLELAVVHLSAYERSHQHVGRNYASGPSRTRMRRVARNQRLQHLDRRSSSGDNKPSSSSFLGTLAVMPFVGSSHAKDAGNSDVRNRRMYLEASFWNVADVFPAVVIGVCFEADRDMILIDMKLPVLDVLLMQACADSPKTLPFLTLMETQRRVREEAQWKSRQFKYVFFSESDQLLVLREPEHLFSHLDRNTHEVLVPHRLIPYSHEILQLQVHSTGVERRLPVTPSHDGFGQRHQRRRGEWKCCLPRASCSGNRTAMEFLKQAMKTSVVPLLNIEGLIVVMGTGNFLLHKYRFCQFMPKAGPQTVCPAGLLL
jgi:hypothetical protein